MKAGAAQQNPIRGAIDWGKLAPLRLRARQIAEGVYAGLHRSALRGAGVEFGGYREYVPGDGAPEHVFASIPDDGRWVATLARFGEGKLKGDELIARATTPIQKYEALFYDAMDHRAAGDAKGGEDLLRQVVAGTGLELSEVMLARDMLDPARSQLGGPLPPDVQVP